MDSPRCPTSPKQTSGTKLWKLRHGSKIQNSGIPLLQKKANFGGILRLKYVSKKVLEAQS